jgi:hypothetical protein
MQGCRCPSLPNSPLTNLQLHKSTLLIYSPVGMAANTLFGQPVEVCTSCIFDTVTNHLHQKNRTPSSNRFEVPLHCICSSSQSMFLPTKPLALPTFNNNSVHRIFVNLFQNQVVTQFCFGPLVFHKCQTYHTRKHVFMKFGH